MKRVFAFIGFSFAITLFAVNVISFSAVRYITLVLLILTVISFIVKNLRQAKVVPVILCSCTAACLLFSYVYSNVTTPQLALDNTETQALLTVTSVGSENSSSGYNYTAKINQLNGEACSMKIRLHTNKQLEAEPYDLINGTVKLYSIADNAYSSYGYYADNIYLSGSLEDDFSVIKTESKPVHYYIIILGQKIKAEIYSSFDEDTGALAVSILTGDKSHLSSEIYNDFKVCGVTHTVAVSGLHTTLVCLSVYYILKLLRCPKIVSSLLTAVTLFVYVAVADFSKSAVRAGIMLAVMLLAKLLNNKADALNSLGIAVFILCLNPYAVFDVSAQLSVCAVLGILVIFPQIRKEKEEEPRFKRYILDSVFLTISVTLAMLPAMCIAFDSISLVGIILNCIIIPLLQLALISVLLMLVFCKSMVLKFIPLKLADFALTAMIKLTDVFSDAFYWMKLSAKTNYLLIAAALVLIFIGLTLIINKTVSVRAASFLAAVLILFSSVFSVYDNNTAVTVSCLNTGGVIISSSDTVVAVHIDDYSDYYALTNENRHKQCAMIFCDAYSDSIKQLFPSAADLSSDAGTYQLDDKITIRIKENEIDVTIFDNCFKIYEKNVIINNIVLSAKIRSGLDDSIVIYYKKGREVKYRYG